MNDSAKRLRNGFLQAAGVTGSLVTWLAGSVDADGITPPVATASGAVRSAASAVDANGAMNLGVQLFVGTVLLVAGLCFAWLLYLMMTAPPEEAAADAAAGQAREKDPLPPGVGALLELLPGAAPRATADFGFGRLLGRLFRAWIGTRLGHPGPM